MLHRFLYYVLAQPLIDDLAYDMLERDLRVLVEENSELAATLPFADECPLLTVGTSNLWDYPRPIQHLGTSLLDWVERYGSSGAMPDLLTEEESKPVLSSRAENAQPGLF